MRSVRLFQSGNVRVCRPFWNFHIFRKLGTSVVRDDNIEPDPYEGNFSFVDCDQYTKVTVIGAAGRVGRTLSLLLKTCPLVDHLCLFDTDKAVKGIGVDISHIDTQCCVSYVCGMRNIQQALDRPDVVVIAAGCPTSPTLSGNKLFEKNAPIVAGLSEACARFCPKACVVLITNPINSLLPVMGEVYQIITNKIPSRKLFGLTALDVVRANTFVAEVVRKDPNSIIVPVIGGTSQDTIVPVFSQMKPYYKIKRGELLALTECLKRAEGNLADCQNCGTRGSSSLSTAYAGFRFTSSLVMALKGAENIIECAYVQSDIIPELEYMASPLRLGLRGIEYNFGYPRLSDIELVGLEHAAATLISDIKLGKEFVSKIEETVQAGLIWKRLAEGNGKENKSFEVEKFNNKKKDFVKQTESFVESDDVKNLNKPILRKQKNEAKKKESILLEGKPRKANQEAPRQAVEEAIRFPMFMQSVHNCSASSRTSPKKLIFGSNDIQSENCSNISSGSISADLDSDSCRTDPSLGKFCSVPFMIYMDYETCVTNEPEPTSLAELSFKGDTEKVPDEKGDYGKTDEKFSPYNLTGFLWNSNLNKTLLEGFHNNQNNLFLNTCRACRTIQINSKRWIMTNDRKNKLDNLVEENRRRVKSSPKADFECITFKTNAIKEVSQKKLWDKKFKQTHYKMLNATARQKFRSFNNKKKSSPSPLTLFLLEKAFKKEPEKSVGMYINRPKIWKITKGKITDDEKYIDPNEKRLVLAKKKDEDSQLTYRNFVLKQLQELKKENDELKRKIGELINKGNEESSILDQSDQLELEKTRLKACWLVMSSTIEAFHNFLKKFSPKTDGRSDSQLKSPDSEGEVFEEFPEEIQKNSKKEKKFDDKYYNYLENLMQDQMECKKSRSRLAK